MKNCNPARFLLAGTDSGSGKSTLTCGLLAAYKKRNLNVSAFKCGPDYIDPIFHSFITKRATTNLDLFLLKPEIVRYLMAQNSQEADLSIIEGVMGLYDGWGVDSDLYSTNQVAFALKAPQVLVVNGKGRGFSLLAEISGYLNFRANNIKAVIINQISEFSFAKIKPLIEDEFKIKALGYLEYNADLAFESRHLGLVVDLEEGEIDKKLSVLVEQVEKSIDLDALLEIAKASEPFDVDSSVANFNFRADLKIGVAKDQAFCFNYQANFDLLEKLGAQIVFFSPLEDEKLPKVDGLFFAGGYPELFLQKLSGNKKFIADLKEKMEKGLPVIAEGGGLIYLSEGFIDADGFNHKLVGFFKSLVRQEKKLKNFGYIELVALKDNVLAKKGDKIRAHEFHYCHNDQEGYVFKAEKKDKRFWFSGFQSEAVYAGYPHFHFWSNPDFLINFLKKCQKFNVENKCK